MEKPPKISFAEQPLVSAPSLNSDLWNIIVLRALQEKSCKDVALTLHNIGRTSKFFAQRLLYDPTMNGQLIQTCAKKYNAELDAICQVDLEFAAAYQLKTFGAKKWLKEHYFIEPKYFKIISYYFFDKLDVPLGQNEHIKEFMREVLPQNKPSIIQRRLNDMHTSSKHNNFPRYTHEIKDFLKQLSEITDSMSHEPRFIFTDTTETSLASNLDIEDEFNGGFLPLTSVFHSTNGSAASKVASLLAAGANPNNRDGYNNSCPLYCAIRKKDLASQKLLLEAGANPDTHYKRINAVWKNHNTPLLQAIAWGPIEAVKQLLASGADPNMPDHAGLYPLEYVITCANEMARQDRIDYLQPLLEAGANPYQRFMAGYTAITLARKYGRKGIEEILIKFAPPKVKSLIHKFEELSKKNK